MPGFFPEERESKESKMGDFIVIALGLALVSIQVSLTIVVGRWNACRRVFISQNHVDEVLADHARLFHNFANSEVELQRQSRNFDFIAAEKAVVGAKKGFWKAHRLAKWMGFAVKKSYRDYLTAPDKAGQTVS